jgi:hypothetical protein
MRNADELDEQWSQLTRVMPSQPAGPRAGRGRIRYAFGGAPRVGRWAAEPPAAAPHADLWVLVCGGIAAAAALAAAFVASGGVPVHAATQPAPAHSVAVHSATVHSVVGQACPSAAASR